MSDATLKTTDAPIENKISLEGVRSEHAFRQKRSLKWLVPTIYIILLMLPIY